MRYVFRLNNKRYTFDSTQNMWIAPNPHGNSFLPDLMADHLILKRRVAVLEQALHDLLGPQVGLSYPPPPGILDSMSAKTHAVLLDHHMDPALTLESCLQKIPEFEDAEGDPT